MVFKPLKKRVNMVQKGNICKYPGCNRAARVKGYCMNHYAIMRYSNKVNSHGL